MTAATSSAAPNTPAEADTTAWFALSPEDALKKQGVDQEQGLASADVESRRAKYGSNKFAAAKKATPLQIFLGQYADPMQIVLVIAGVVCLFLPDQFFTGVMLLLLTLFNAMMGMNQEGKASSAADALTQKMVVTAKTRRNGDLVDVPMDQLVPGDIVNLQAGDLVPADARILDAATLRSTNQPSPARACPRPSRSAPSLRMRRSATGSTWPS